jgi:hypothetical protein
LPWSTVPVALTFLLLALTGLATRALARELLPGSIAQGAATLAGCAALFSGYTLFTAYERSAFGELAGGFWIPLLLLFILRDRDCIGPAWRRAFEGSTLPLALVVAGCWLSNAPLGVMACYLLAAVALAAALLARSWAPVLRSMVAVALGTGLAGVYLLPAIQEQCWIDIRQAIDDPGLAIENSWLFARHTDPMLQAHDAELLKVSFIAVAMIAVALAGATVVWLRTCFFAKEEGDGLQPAHQVGERSTALAAEGNPHLFHAMDVRAKAHTLQKMRAMQRSWIILALIPIAVLFLQFPVSLPVWNLLPKLRFLQFPWRWLLALEAPMAIFLAAAIWSRRKKLRLALLGLCAVGFLATTVLAGVNFYQRCYPEDSVPGMLATIGSGGGAEGYDEYTPPGADNTQVATGLPDACLVADPAAKLGMSDSPDGALDVNPVWSAEQGSCERTLRWQLTHPEQKHLRADFSHAGFLVLRLRAYPAWRVTVNGQSVGATTRRDDGLIAVPVPRGAVDLAVDWTATPDAVRGRWLSCLAALLLTCLGGFERKLRRPRLS